MVMHVFDLSTQAGEASRSLCIQSQPGLQSEFQVIQGYIVRASLKNFLIIVRLKVSERETEFELYLMIYISR